MLGSFAPCFLVQSMSDTVLQFLFIQYLYAPKRNFFIYEDPPSHTPIFCCHYLSTVYFFPELPLISALSQNNLTREDLAKIYYLYRANLSKYHMVPPCQWNLDNVYIKFLSVDGACLSAKFTARTNCLQSYCNTGQKEIRAHGRGCGVGNRTEDWTLGLLVCIPSSSTDFVCDHGRIT